MSKNTFPNLNPDGRPPKEEETTQGPATLARSLSREARAVIQTTLNVKQIDYVNALFKTGLFGNSPTEAARRAFDAGLKHLLMEHNLWDKLTTSTDGN